MQIRCAGVFLLAQVSAAATRGSAFILHCIALGVTDMQTLLLYCYLTCCAKLGQSAARFVTCGLENTTREDSVQWLASQRGNRPERLRPMEERAHKEPTDEGGRTQQAHWPHLDAC